MVKPIVIFGAGGHGREILQIVLDINALAPRWQPMGFLAEPGHETRAEVHGLPVLGGIDWLIGNPHAQVIVAIGSPAVRRRIAVAIAAQTRNEFANLIHPSAWLGGNVEIGSGSVLFPGCKVTTDVVLGCHVHLNLDCTLSHNVRIGDFVTLGPRVTLCGNVDLDEGVEVGASSVFIPRTRIGAWSVVGAGSVVTRSQPDNVTVVAAPARIVKTHAAGWQDGSN